MIEAFIKLIILVIGACVLQRNFKIPAPVTLMLAVIVGQFLGVTTFDVTDHQFDQLVIVTLPLLLAADAMKLKTKDLTDNAFSLFWVAVVAVVLSVGAGMLVNTYVLIDYQLSVWAVGALFCMVAATDPITVSAIFANFKVPHKLKVFTEGEGLWNDATALILFTICLVGLTTTDQLTPSFLAKTVFSVVVGAMMVGTFIGIVTTYALRVSDDPMVEASILILATYVSYFTAEHFHYSGILAVIICVLIANHKINEILNSDEAEISEAESYKDWSLLKYSITCRDNHRSIITNIEFISMFAAATLFASIASLVDFKEMLTYWKEIVAVFIASTLIRGVIMFKFALVSNHMNTATIHKHWWAVLTFSGSKGAISILMVHMIPNSFQYKSLFEHIIIGNIILSTFVYAAVLALIFMKYNDKFEAECKLEEQH